MQPPSARHQAPIQAHAFLAARFPNLQAVPFYRTGKASVRRLNVVTDSINEGSLFGGVGTALILAGLVAQERQVALRIITRTEQPDARNIRHLYALYGIKPPFELEFCHADLREPERFVDLSDGDVFLTTSWWSTAATLPGVPPRSIHYLIQEDERMFYPLGDEHLRCSQMMSNPDIHFIVNSSLLANHFRREGFDNIVDTGHWFEPAFPRDLFHGNRQVKTPRNKRQFVFYARINNHRNLFTLGLEVIDKALRQGLLDDKLWDIVFVGSHIPDVALHGGVRPRRLENLPWASYAELVRKSDLALCLMYTPHPSYPPLDFAAGGAVAVTNRFGLKQDLSAFSRNIVCGEPTVHGMLEALESGIELACLDELRAANHAASTLPDSWQETLAPVVATIQV